jgi:hypothetical protein
MLVFPLLPLSYLLDKAVIFPHPLVQPFSSPHIPFVFSLSLSLLLRVWLKPREMLGDGEAVSPALQTRLFTINFRFVLNYLISAQRETERDSSSLGWMLQGRGEVVTLLVLEAQLSYGLIMLGNEKKKATALLAAGSLSQAVPGWIREAHGSDGSCERSRHFFGTAVPPPWCKRWCRVRVYQSLDDPTALLTGGKLNESIHFCVLV